MSEYPRDRFDDIPEYTDRKGGHRAHFDPPVETAGLRWIAAAAALALAVGAFSFFILPGLLNSSETEPAAAPTTTSAPASSESAEPTAPEEPSSTPAQTDGTDAASPTQTAAPSESAGTEPATAPEPTAAETTPATPEQGSATSSVQVYNATGIPGLAGTAGDELRGAGFTVSGVGDWQGFAVAQSAVYFSGGEQTAQAVGAQLGLPVVYDARVPGVVVVLASAR